jgi:hypothetical protein
MIEFDYRNKYSFQMMPCNSSHDSNALFIRRDAPSLVIDANLTLPWVKYVETIIAPTSITGGGTNISLAPVTSSILRIRSDQTPSREYGVGDVILIYVEFSNAVIVSDKVYLQVINLDRELYFDYYHNPSTAIFSFVVLPKESVPWLTYADEFALKGSSSCDIFDKEENFCAPQSLPKPSFIETEYFNKTNLKCQTGGFELSLLDYALACDSKQLSQAVDELTPQFLSVTTNTSAVKHLQFVVTEVYFGSETCAGTVFGIPLQRAGTIQTCPESLLGITSYSIPPSLLQSVSYCDDQGASWYYREIVDDVAALRVIMSSKCPNHFSTCQAADCSYTNGSRAIPSESTIVIPLFPVLANSITYFDCKIQNVGVALNGVSFRSANSSAACVDSVKVINSNSIDKCGGQADEYGEYVYPMAPVCLIEQLKTSSVQRAHSPQIGWALDGFPIYGNIGPETTIMASCSSQGLTEGGSTPCLDECNGYYALLPDVDNYVYRYYIPGEVGIGSCAKYIRNGGTCERLDDPCCTTAIPTTFTTLGCFKGCLNSDQYCFLGTRTGLVNNTSPELSFHPTVVYDGSSSSVQAQVNAYKIDPLLYYPSNTWDSVVDVRDSNRTLVFSSGTIVQVDVEFTEAVFVDGLPFLEFLFESNVFMLFYSNHVNEKTIKFVHELNASVSNGRLECTSQSRIDINGGRILRQANFLPILPVDLDLERLCCDGSQCTMSADILQSIPTVRKVFAQSGTIFSYPESIFIYVEFSQPVVVVGSVSLTLDLATLPNATYTHMSSSTTLALRYTVQASDYTSSLDYTSQHSLRVTSHGAYDGIFAYGKYVPIAANITLPRRGTITALPFTTFILCKCSVCKSTISTQCNCRFVHRCCR